MLARTNPWSPQIRSPSALLLMHLTVPMNPPANVLPRESSSHSATDLANNFNTYLRSTLCSTIHLFIMGDVPVFPSLSSMICEEMATE